MWNAGSGVQCHANESVVLHSLWMKDNVTSTSAHLPLPQNHSALSQYAVPLFCYWLTCANHVNPKWVDLKIQGQEVDRKADRKMSSNSELANEEVWNLWLHQKPLAHCSHHIAMDVEGLKGVELTIKAAGDEYQSPNPDRLAQLGSLAVKSTHPGSMSCWVGFFLSSSSSAQNRGHICSRRALVPPLLICEL